MDTERNEALEAFAEEVRRVTGRAMSRIGWGDRDAAVVLISDLCGKAGEIVHRAKMRAEVEALRSEEFSLAGLRVDLASAAPERETE